LIDIGDYTWEDRMKRGLIFLIFLIFLLFSVYCFAQPGQSKPGERFIDRIGVNDDIGGVVFSKVEIKPNIPDAFVPSTGIYAIVFRNNNNFPVTVLYEFVSGGENPQKGNSTIVLNANETKQTQEIFYTQFSVVLIVKRLRSIINI
jgi:hypothetical protein